MFVPIGLFLLCGGGAAGLLVIPEDVPTGLFGIYGFSPRFFTGTDSRFGFGFRLGNHADFQVLYEFGPQTATKPLQLRSASYRTKTVRRRPLVELLLRTGLLRETETQDDFRDSYHENILSS